jgi:hypothetical protein
MQRSNLSGFFRRFSRSMAKSNIPLPGVMALEPRRFFSATAAGLDLTGIGGSTLPTAVAYGAAEHGVVTVELANIGSSAIDGTITTDIYASADGTVDGSSILLGTTAHHLDLKPGSTGVAASVAIKSLPAQLMDGSYVLYAVTTDPSGNSTGPVAGPALSVAAPFVSFSESIISTTLHGSNVSGQPTGAYVRLGLTNNGNIASAGITQIAIYVSPDGTVASGTLVRSVYDFISLQPSRGRVVIVPLLSLPAVGSGNYFLVAQVTDPRNDVTTAVTGSTFELAPPFLSLSPVFQNFDDLGFDGNAIINITNNGNVNSNAADTFIAIYTSTDGTLANGTFVTSESIHLAIPPGRTRTVSVRLNSDEARDAQQASYLVVRVIDAFDNSETATLG